MLIVIDGGVNISWWCKQRCCDGVGIGCVTFALIVLITQTILLEGQGIMWDNYENIQLGPWIIQVKCFCALLLFFQKLFAAGYFWWNYSMAHLFPNKDSTKCAGGSSPFVRKQGIVTLFTNNGIPRKHNAAIVQSPVHVASHLEDFSILSSIMYSINITYRISLQDFNTDHCNNYTNHCRISCKG